MTQDGLKRYIEFLHIGGSISRILVKPGDNPESNLPKDIYHYRYIDSHSMRDTAQKVVETVYVGRVISQEEVCAEFPDAEGLIETMRDERLPSVLLTRNGDFRIIKEGTRVVDIGKFNTGNL